MQLFLKIKRLFSKWSELGLIQRNKIEQQNFFVGLKVLLPPLTSWSERCYLVAPLLTPSAAAQGHSGARHWQLSSPASSRDSSRSEPAEKDAASAAELPPGPAPPLSWTTPLSRPGGASWTWTPPGSLCSSSAWWRTGVWPCCWTRPCLASPRRCQSSRLRDPVRKSSAAKWRTLTCSLSGRRISLAGSWWPGRRPPPWPPSASHSGSGCCSTPPGCLKRWAPGRLWSSQRTVHTQVRSLVSAAFWRRENVAWRCSVWLWLQQAFDRCKWHPDDQNPLSPWETSELKPSPSRRSWSSQVEQQAECGKNQTSGTSLLLGSGSCMGAGSTSWLWPTLFCWMSSGH